MALGVTIDAGAGGVLGGGSVFCTIHNGWWFFFLCLELFLTPLVIMVRTYCYRVLTILGGIQEHRPSSGPDNPLEYSGATPEVSEQKENRDVAKHGNKKPSHGTKSV